MRRALLAAALIGAANAAAAEPIDDAFRAAFGKTGSATIVSTATDLREQVKYEPGQLLDTHFGPVLVAIGEVIDGSHASSGKVAIFYLTKTKSGYSVARKFLPAFETGSFGKLSDWGVSRAFGGYPVIAVEGGGTWQGYTCSVLTLVELTPAGPRELVDIPSAYDNSGSVGDDQGTVIEGKVANIKSGTSFDVVYTGTKTFTDHYVRKSNHYLLANESRMESC